MKIVDLRFKESTNQLGVVDVLPTMAGIGDLGSVTTTNTVVKWQHQPVNYLTPSGTVSNKAIKLTGDSALGNSGPDGNSIIDNLLTLRPWIGFDLLWTKDGLPNAPLSTYSMSFVWNGTPLANSWLGQQYAHIVEFVSNGLRAGTRSWGVFQGLHNSPNIFTNFPNGRFGFSTSSTVLSQSSAAGRQDITNINTGTPLLNGTYKFEIQVDAASNPKVCMRVYQVSTGQRIAGATANPASVLCDGIRIGDWDSASVVPSENNWWWTDLQVWDTYDADGAFPALNSSTSTKTTAAWTGVRSEPTLDSSYRSTSYRPTVGETKYSGADNIPYGSTGSTPNTSRWIDLFIPNGTPGDRNRGFPLVVWVHGGYFALGNKSSIPEGWRRELVNAGYAVASVGYVRSTLKADEQDGPYQPWGTTDSLSENVNGYGRYPSWVCDVKLAAVRLAQKYSQAGSEPKLNSNNFGFDGQSIIVAGHSAGGNIAMLAATSRDLTDDGSGRDMTLLGNPTYAVDETGSTYTGPDPVFLGAISYAGPTDMNIVLSYDRTDPQSVKPGPNQVFLVPAVTRPPGGGDLFSNLVGSSTGRAFAISASHAFLGNKVVQSYPNLANTSVENAIARNTARVPHLYYVRGQADYLVHWEHELSLAAQMAASGLSSRYTSGVTPAPHETANEVFNYGELLGWLNTRVEESGGTPGFEVETVLSDPEDGSLNVSASLAADASQRVSAPSSRFTFTPTTGMTPLTVRFDGSSSSNGDGSPVDSYLWDLGDGTTATTRVVTHTFDDPGVYQVALTVTVNDVPDTATDVVTVVDSNPQPVASDMFKEAVRQSHRAITRAELVTPSGNRYWLPIVDGTLSIDRRNQVWRSADMTLAVDELGTASREALEKINVVASDVVIYAGLFYENNSTELVQLARMRIETFERKLGVATVQVAASDYASMLNDHPLTPDYTNKLRNVSLPAAINLLLADSIPAPLPGMNSQLVVTNDVPQWFVPSDATFDGDNRLDTIIRWCEAAGAYFFNLPNGTFYLTAKKDNTPAVLEITDGVGGVLVDANEAFSRLELYNAVNVRFDSPDSANVPIRAFVVDNNPDSPTFWDGPFGRRVKEFSDIPANTPLEAQNAAIQKLNEVRGIQRGLRITGVRYPTLVPGDTIGVNLPNEDSLETHVVESVTHNLAGATVEIETRFVS